MTAPLAQPVEQWRAIPGYEGCYEISDCGRVRSLARTCFKGGRSGGIRLVKERILKPSPHGLRILDGVRSRPYLGVNLYLNGRISRRFVHVLVLIAFRGPRADDQETRHLDGDCHHNCLSNLTWGTKVENKADMRRHDTAPYGTRHSNAKLTEIDIPIIRAAHKAGATYNSLARRFGVSGTAIKYAVIGKTWVHV